MHKILCLTMFFSIVILPSFRIPKFLLLHGGTSLITGNSLVVQLLIFDFVLFHYFNLEELVGCYYFTYLPLYCFRCAVLSFLTLESDGPWKIVSPPLQYLDCLHASCLPQMNQFAAERKLVQKGPASNGTYSINSFRCRSLLESNKKLLDSKAIKSLNELSGKFSCRSSCSSSALISSDSSAISDIPIGGAKMHRYGKKNPRKKAKKKGIECKKISCDFVCAETEVSSEDSARGSLLLEACGNNDLNPGDGSVSCSTAQETFLPDIRASKDYFDGNSERIIQPLGTVHSISSETVEGDASQVLPSATQNLSGNYNVCGSENQPLVKVTGCSHFDGGVDPRERLFVGCCGDFHSKGFSDNNSSESQCVSSNSDYDGLNLKFNEKESFGVGLLEEKNSPSRENYCSRHISVRDEVDVNAEVERAKHGIQGCTNSETRLVLPGKKTKQNKKLTGSSKINRFGIVGNSQRHTGKENNHTVWQKVQKNNSGGCCAQLDQVSPICKQFKGNCKPVGVQIPKVKDRKTGNRKQLKDKSSRKLRRKNTSVQDKIYRPCKSGIGSNTSSMVDKQPNERLDIPSMGFDIRRLNSASKSQLQNDNTGKCLTSESFESTQACLDGLMSDELVSDGLNSQRVENEYSSSSRSCNSLDQSNLLEVHSPIYLPHLFFQRIDQVTQGSSLAEHSKHNNHSRSPLQNWVPSGAEGSRLTTLAGPDSSSLKYVNKLPAELGTSEESIQERVVCDLQDPVSVVTEVSKSSRDGNHGPLEDECEVQKMCDHDITTLQDHSCELDMDEHFNCKSSCEDASRMEQAVNNACRVQLASEAVQMETGCPIAEFETFLHLSSPVISQRPKLKSCKICPRNLLGDAILCSHEIPNISLGCLWQWYEKHGSYGLEIKAKGNENANRFSYDNSAFLAYFVPFLSAVQLFKSHKTHAGTTANPAGLDSCVRNIKIKEPSTCHLPIFSVLFPKPHTDDASIPLVSSQFHSSEQPLASEKTKISEQSVDLKLSGESELVFEYFEVEPPQQRRPLFDK